MISKVNNNQINFQGMSRRAFLKKGATITASATLMPKIFARDLIKGEPLLLNYENKNSKLVKPNKELIDSYFAKTTYEKDCEALLHPNNKFSIVKHRNGISLKNYEFPMWQNVASKVDNGELPSIKGVCNELGAYLAKFMAVKHPDTDIFLIRGKEPNYFYKQGSEHVFPMANLNRSENMVVIDPSFKNTNPFNYQLESTIMRPNDLKNIKLGKFLGQINRDRSIPYNRINSVPLGFIKDLSTSRESKAVLQKQQQLINGKTLGYMCITNYSEHEKPKLSLDIQNPEGEFYDFAGFGEWLSKLERDNPVRNFLERIKGDNVFKGEPSNSPPSFIRFQ